jgi:hypothetical protein
MVRDEEARKARSTGCTHRTAWYAWDGVLDKNTVLYKYPR